MVIFTIIAFQLVVLTALEFNLYVITKDDPGKKLHKNVEKMRDLHNLYKEKSKIAPV